jgi:hypothetical protein
MLIKSIACVTCIFCTLSIKAQTAQFNTPIIKPKNYSNKTITLKPFVEPNEGLQENKLETLQKILNSIVPPSSNDKYMILLDTIGFNMPIKRLYIISTDPKMVIPK